MGFSRQGDWSGLPFPSPRDLPEAGIEPRSLTTPALAGSSLLLAPTGKPTMQSMELSRPEYWSGWPFPSPADLPNLGIKPRSPTLQGDSLLAEPQGKPQLRACLASNVSNARLQDRRLIYNSELLSYQQWTNGIWRLKHRTMAQW